MSLERLVLDSGEVLRLSLPSSQSEQAQYLPELPENPTPPSIPESDTLVEQPAPKPDHEGPLPETGSSFEMLGVMGVAAVAVGGIVHRFSQNRRNRLANTTKTS